MPYPAVTASDIPFLLVESKVRIGKDGGIPLILQAMKIHMSIAAVHQKACGVLRNLAINGVR